ncbi:MAG: MarR family winged helix-turn-helix transcriptional regulator [Miltoncostaeaceae bacterium]
MATIEAREEGPLDPDRLRATGALLAAHTAVADAIEREAVRPTGHDPVVLDLLVRVDQAGAGGARAADLARRLLVSPGHVSRRLDRAEALGLVVRRADPQDRRAQQIVLTKTGEAVL